jgi:hypothetical protein
MHSEVERTAEKVVATYFEVQQANRTLLRQVSCVKFPGFSNLWISGPCLLTVGDYILLEDKRASVLPQDAERWGSSKFSFGLTAQVFTS